MDPIVAVRGIKHSWLHLWAPLVLGWWVGILFMIGSALFAIGGAMGMWPEMPGIRLIDKSPQEAERMMASLPRDRRALYEDP